MSSPKKKLPTGPIRIEHPTYSFGNNILESNLLENKKQDSQKPEYVTQDIGIQDTLSNLPQQSLNAQAHEVEQKQDSSKLETSLQESNKQEAFIESTWSNTLAVSKKDKRKQESIKQENSFEQIECKKVAMRLSETAVDRLRSFRASTGLPYEILVDVMICNLDKFPSEIQKDFLSQVKQLRLQRLVTGQNKGLETAKQKLSELE